MNALPLILCIPAMLAIAGASRHGHLWKEHAKKLDEALAQKNLVRRDANRQIGLPHFGVDFEEPLKPESVHALRPQDIDTIGAMGDSLTAAFGAEADRLATIAQENRGICFSVGGDYTLEDAITLPNILKKFNNRLDGYSVGNGPRVDKYPYGFNVAVSGARAKNMLGQAQNLINLLKTDNRSRFDSDWKLVTMFIGGNDLCAIGRDPNGTTAEVYVSEIKTALDMLHDEVPRMFVNIVDILEVYLLPQVGTGYGSTQQCRAAQQAACGYVIDTYEDPVEQKRLIDLNKQYQIQLKALIDSGTYDTRDDFTVVIQPFLRDSVLPYTEDGQVDSTYFAPDCFHFSDIGHAMGAINLWNNMLEPVGSKSTVWNITDLKVPTEEHPYFFTSKNSGPGSTVPPVTEETDGTEVPIWLIVVVAVLLFLLFLQVFVLVWLLQARKSKNKGHIVDEKGHVNESMEGHRI